MTLVQQNPAERAAEVMTMLFALIVALAAAGHAKPFTAELMVTNQPGTVFMKWQQGGSFELPNLKKARRGEPVAALVLFSDCVPDPKGDCDVRMDMRVTDPSGETYGESKDSEVWAGKPAPRPGTSQLGMAYIVYSVSFCGPGGCFEPGTYRPNSPIFGDEAYRVLDADTLEVLVQQQSPGSRGRSSP